MQIKTNLNDALADFLAFCIGIFILGIPILSIVGWCIHIFHCVAHEKVAMLLVGMFIFPVGIIHGWMVAFGIV